jgi:hypothetical protein
MAVEEAESLLKNVPFSRGKKPPKQLGPGGAPWYDCGLEEEFLESQSSLMHRRITLMLPSGCLAFQPRGLGALSSSFRKVRKDLHKAWPGAHPVSKEKTVIQLLEQYSSVERETKIFLPGTPDPDHPGVLGTPWVAGDSARTRMRKTVFSSLESP